MLGSTLLSIASALFLLPAALAAPVAAPALPVHVTEVTTSVQAYAIAKVFTVAATEIAPIQGFGGVAIVEAEAVTLQGYVSQVVGVLTKVKAQLVLIQGGEVADINEILALDVDVGVFAGVVLDVKLANIIEVLAIVVAKLLILVALILKPLVGLVFIKLDVVVSLLVSIVACVQIIVGGLVLEVTAVLGVVANIAVGAVVVVVDDVDAIFQVLTGWEVICSCFFKGIVLAALGQSS